MKTQVRIVFLFLMLCAISAEGQDMHFTQFYASPTYLNPAFTGAGVCSRLSTNYRNQWPGINKTYQSYLFSIDHHLVQYNLGVGLLFGSDVAGTGNLKTTSINPLVAYEIKISRKQVLRVGLQPGLGIRSINYNNLLFGDQIARGGGVPSIEVPKESTYYFDMGAGVLTYTRRFWLGASFFHINKPDESLIEEQRTELPVKYTVHGGYKFLLNGKEPDEMQQRAVTVAAHYRGQNEFDQFDIGGYYTYHIFNAGLWYRGIPGLKSYKDGYANNDAIAVLLGIKANKLNIGYSYDYTISQLTNVSHGAHELSLSYQLCKLKPKKKSIVVSCPKF